MAASLTFDEQELLVSICGKDDTIKITTSYPHWIKRLDKYCAENPDEWKKTSEYVEDGRVLSANYEAPKDFLKLQKKRRYISEEQRKASAERLARYRIAAGNAEIAGE